MPDDDAIDALSALNPVPDDAEVDLPNALQSIPDSMRRSRLARTYTSAAILAGLVLGWMSVTAPGILPEQPSSTCVVVSGRVVSNSAGVCVADLAP